MPEARSGVMTTVYVPEIAATDYSAFRQIMSDEFPATFEEWQAKVERWAIGRSRHRIEKVTVEPAKFARYCLQARKRSTLESLVDCAYAVAAGKWE